MNLLPVPRPSVLPEALQPPLEPGNGTLWVMVGSRLGETWWYPSQPATFELVAGDLIANDTEVNFGPSPWPHNVVLRHVACGPGPEDMRIMCLLDNGALILPPKGVMVFARHALIISFEPPFSMPVSEG